MTYKRQSKKLKTFIFSILFTFTIEDTVNDMTQANLIPEHLKDEIKTLKESCDQFLKSCKFLVDQNPGSSDFDSKFTQFLVKDFPYWLSSIEKILEK